MSCTGRGRWKYHQRRCRWSWIRGTRQAERNYERHCQAVFFASYRHLPHSKEICEQSGENAKEKKWRRRRNQQLTGKNGCGRKPLSNDACTSEIYFKWRRQRYIHSTSVFLFFVKLSRKSKWDFNRSFIIFSRAAVQRDLWVTPSSWPRRICCSLFWKKGSGWLASTWFPFLYSVFSWFATNFLHGKETLDWESNLR